MVKDLTLWEMEGKGVSRTEGEVASSLGGSNLSCNPQVPNQRDLIIYFIIQTRNS